MSRRDLSLLTHDAVISLFSLDLSVIGEQAVFNFCNFVEINGDSVSWQGTTYEAIPIMAEGFEYSGQGQFPTPQLTISNVLSAITPLLLAYDDLVGAKFTRVRTFAKHLDSGSNPSSFELNRDVYFVERKASESKLSVVFELSAAIDLGEFQLPARLALANLCVWAYRSAECGYTGGPVADRNDKPVDDFASDRCGHRVSSCKLRFGENKPLSFGGFPGLDNGGRFG